MATARWMVILAAIAGVVPHVTGAPLAQLRLLSGNNATCPWRVLYTFTDGDGAEHDLCAQQLDVSFVAPGEKEGTRVPPGYDRLSTGNYYKVHKERRRWHDAREACEREGAHLVVIETAAEADALRKYFGWVRNDEFYISTLHAGFHSKLSTVLGNTLTYERWGDYQPGSYICGQINSYAWLSYGSCSNSQSFICEVEATATSESGHVPPVVPESPVLSPEGDRSQKRSLLSEKGYTHLPGWNGIFIKNYGDGNSSWESANETCSNDGAFLPIVESADNAEALIDYVNAASISDFYLGVKTGDPITVLGGELAHIKYQRWDSDSTETVCLYSDNKLFYNTMTCSDDGYWKSTLCLANVE